MKKMTLFYSTLLLLLMAILLIPGLNDRSIWGDEGWSIRFTDGESPRDTILALTEDRHPPLYFLVLDTWREIAGEEEVALRILAVFAALLSGAFLYRLGKALFGTTAGLLALLIFALLDKQIVFSQEVRHYTWLILWAVASSLALIFWLRDEKFLHSLIFVAAVTGGLYTHSLYALIIVGHVIFILIAVRSWRKIVRVSILYFFAALAYLPWLMVFYYQYLKQGNITHTLPVNWNSVELLGPEFFGRPLALTVGLLILGMLSPFFRYAPGWKFERPQLQAVLLPVLGILIPLLFVVLVKDDGTTLLNDRNLAMALPFMALLMGVGITAFTGFSRSALIIFIVLNGILTTDVEYTAPPWREIAQTINQRQIDGQPIIYNVHGEAAAMGYHLREDVGTDIPLASIYDLQNDPNTEILATLRFETLADATGFWFIFWGEESPLFAPFEEWGYQRTYTDYQLHFDSKIYMHRYDSLSLLDKNVTSYGNLLKLHQGYAPEKAKAGETIYVSLWWSAAQLLNESYTVSVILLNPDGTVAAQHDSFPQEGAYPTTQWQPGNLIYDAHPIKLPVTPGTYQIAVKVYTLRDGSILPAGTGQEYHVTGTIRVR